MIKWINTKNALPPYRTETCLVWFKNTCVPYLGWYNSNINAWITRRKGYKKTREVAYWCLLNRPEE